MAFNNSKLKGFRKSAGFTQAKIAELIGVARTTYADYEAGRIQPPLTSIERICTLLNIPINELADEDIIIVHQPEAHLHIQTMGRGVRKLPRNKTTEFFDWISGNIGSTDLTRDEKELLMATISYIYKQYSIKYWKEQKEVKYHD